MPKNPKRSTQASIEISITFLMPKRRRKKGRNTMKKLTALLVLVLTMGLSILPAQAEVERSKLLDAAFSMLEEGNDFVRRYNEMTGAEVTATFVDGCPYFFGGKADDETTLTRLFSRAPLYSKREIWEQTRFYDKGSYYLYGLDCSGFTQWVYAGGGAAEAWTACPT